MVQTFKVYFEMKSCRRSQETLLLLFLLVSVPVNFYIVVYRFILVPGNNDMFFQHLLTCYKLNN